MQPNSQEHLYLWTALEICLKEKIEKLALTPALESDNVRG